VKICRKEKEDLAVGPGVHTDGPTLQNGLKRAGVTISRITVFDLLQSKSMYSNPSRGNTE